MRFSCAVLRRLWVLVLSRSVRIVATLNTQVITAQMARDDAVVAATLSAGTVVFVITAICPRLVSSTAGF